MLQGHLDCVANLLDSQAPSKPRQAPSQEFSRGGGNLVERKAKIFPPSPLEGKKGENYRKIGKRTPLEGKKRPNYEEEKYS